MGNNDEIFTISHGKLWQVKYEYQYLYEFYPSVEICAISKLILKGKSLSIMPVGSFNLREKAVAPKTNYQVKVVLKPSGFRSYFLADSDLGDMYLLEWYGGHDPGKGESTIGELRGCGFKDVFNPDSGNSGKVYVDDYMLSKARALEKLREKCR